MEDLKIGKEDTYLIATKETLRMNGVAHEIYALLAGVLSQLKESGQIDDAMIDFICMIGKKNNDEIKEQAEGAVKSILDKIKGMK